MNIQWYPGHMTKARRMMQEDIKLIDIVIELVDSRIPFSSKNPDIDELAKNKYRLILLNKSDLADDAVTTKVSVKTPRVLATTIPYSSGWSAKGYDLQKINNGFIGIPLHSGQNNIQLTYETPGLTIGRWLSLIGIVLFVLTTFIQRYRK